jgi:aspartate/methionine/tyrosine aminotransferase
MLAISSKMQDISECRIRNMTRVAQQFGAINLAQGFPDFDPPAELLAAACQRIQNGFNQYAVTWGAPKLREALAGKFYRFAGVPIEGDRHITVTCGATEAMAASCLAVCAPGDKVALFSPYYENYAADLVLAGANPIYVPLHPPTFRFDPNELRKAVRQGIKALILCNPSNPTGRVFTRSELQTVADLAREYDFYVITDEVYEHIVYMPNWHTYIASLPGMFERTISCGSLSKTFSITGWRLGYAIAPAGLTTAVRKVHDFLTVGAPNPFQEAGAVAVNFPDAYYRDLANEYAQRRTLFLGYLDKAGLPYVEPEGTYFVLVDISGLGFPNDTLFCEWMAKEIGVAGVPGSVFFHHPEKRYIRLHFSKKEATLNAAGERLLRIGRKV